MVKFILILLLSSLTIQSAHATEQVPVVSMRNFALGNEWIFDYFDNEGIYSTERYRVIEVKGSEVTFEMASRYRGGDPELKPHHMMKADVSKCLWAYSNPTVKKVWSPKLFYLDRGRWIETEAKTLVFEEKFNCNPHIQTKIGAPYLTEFSLIDGENVFMQKLWRKIPGTWFAMEGEQAGIAIRKDFEGDATTRYYFKVRR